MIENPEPKDWRQLQTGVCRIFKEIGLEAEENKLIKTPRGSVSLDVYAIDPGSVDSIEYIVECKNWESSVPQSVVHAFTTVMHEVGANIGYLISKKGIQKGAKKYLNNTNIKRMTYLDFQEHYRNLWVERHFCSTIWDVADALIQYTEPINSRRERFKDELSPQLNKRFHELYDKYWLFGMMMALVASKSKRIFSKKINKLEISTSQLNDMISETLGEQQVIMTIYLREFLDNLILLIENITDQFNTIFGKNIFLES